jgi:hypothetical protein
VEVCLAPVTDEVEVQWSLNSRSWAAYLFEVEFAFDEHVGDCNELLVQIIFLQVEDITRIPTEEPYLEVTEEGRMQVLEM